MSADTPGTDPRRTRDGPATHSLLAEGRVLVAQADGTRASVVLHELGPGEPFGLIGLLVGSARIATVTAISDGRLLALDLAPFLQLVGAGPGLRSELLLMGTPSKTASAPPRIRASQPPRAA